MAEHVLLAGCGRLGTELGLQLIAQGHEVTGLRRRGDLLPSDFHRISADLTETADLKLPDVDSVVITLTADGSDADLYARTYLSGLQGLARALPRTPRRVVYVSSTRVLGDRAGETLTEGDEPRPGSESARVLLRAEKEAGDLLNALILRPAGIYGPDRTALLKRVLEGQEVNFDKVTNRVHSSDLLSAIRKLLTTVDPPQLLHAVDREPCELGKIVDFLAHQLRVAVPPHAKLTPRGKRLDGSRFHQFMGELKYPTFREGYLDILKR